MGRVLLLAVLLAACSGPGDPGDLPSDPPSEVPARVSEGHAGLACVACHQGNRADVGLASVPPSTCTDSDCHADLGPRQVDLSTSSFEHRNHTGDSEIAVGCAGCHTHDSGAAPLSAGADACALCHAQELDGDVGQECRTCHQHPDHPATTSQSVTFAHDGLPWVSGGCVRCHYDVGRPTTDVEVGRCSACHLDALAATAAGIGEDLHPTHEGIACVTCHDSEMHRIQAMSSAVNLRCADCHEVPHGLEEAAEWLDPPSCNACHTGVHEEQQRLLLGFLPAGMDAGPSEKFMDGLTCRSCHLDVGGEAAAPPTEGSRQACVGCHRREFGQVLTWWEEGARERSALVRSYLDRASNELTGAPDAARTLVDEASTLTRLVEGGGAVHNLPLAHRIFQESLRRTAEAYRRAGMASPTPPSLGRAPSMGLCVYCHYRIGETTLSGGMSEAFHESLIGARGR